MDSAYSICITTHYERIITFDFSFQKRKLLSAPAPVWMAAYSKFDLFSKRDNDMFSTKVDNFFFRKTKVDNFFVM